ncbi:uncharacterized protein LOC130675907 [Microplitis mediator]|uniref:uncharacterized protein LOC130675907 n=1 Tax=Microplitis mediator TaxID=375433 RepID=UPI0025568421|nr:uncharacterized protein LOC130675907 [Microplitis mediator]
MNVIVQGWQSVSAATEQSELAITGNKLAYSNLEITVNAFVEDYNSTVNFIRSTIEATNTKLRTEVTPVIFAFGRTGSGKSSTLIGDPARKIPGLASSLFPDAAPDDLRFRVQEWSSKTTKRNHFRDIVRTQDPAVTERSFIPWNELTWEEFSEFWPTLERRTVKDNGVHQKSSRGVLIIEIERKSTEKKVFLIDIPGLQRKERDQGGDHQPSPVTKWISSMTTSFMMYLRKDSSADPVWLEIDAVFPDKTVAFLLACIKRPYIRKNVYSTINFLHGFKDLRPGDWRPGGSRQSISPAPHRRQRPDQVSPSRNLLQVPAITVDAAAPAMSRDIFEELIEQMRDLSINKFNQLGADVENNHAAITEIHAAVTENLAAITENNAAITENNAAITENNAAITENNAAINELRELHDADLDILKVQYQDSINELRDLHVADINNLKVTYEAKIDELTVRYDAQINNLLAAFNQLQTRHDAEIRDLRAQLENQQREHRQSIVTPPRASPPPQDVQADAAPVEQQQPEEENRQSESARESSSTNQSNSPRDSSQDDFPDVTFTSSASPGSEISGADESAIASPAPPVPSCSSESPENAQRSRYALRSRSNVRDSIIHNFLGDHVSGRRPAVLPSSSSSDDDDSDARKTSLMLRTLKLDDPQRARINYTSTLSFAVDDANLYANTNFADHIGWHGRSTTYWKCKTCDKPFKSWAVILHVWACHLDGLLKCDVEGCDFVCRSHTTMRLHSTTH